MSAISLLSMTRPTYSTIGWPETSATSVRKPQPQLGVMNTWRRGDALHADWSNQRRTIGRHDERRTRTTARTS